MEESKAAGGGEAADAAEQKLFLAVERNDGNMIVSFSANDLEARADFLPAFERGRPLTVDSVKNFLGRVNLVHGVKWQDIEDAVLACNRDHRQIRDVLIARGDAPVSEVAEYFEKNPALGKNRPAADDGTPIDYRAISPFIIVKKDQALAKLRLRKPGKAGRNIHGAEIPFPVVRPEGVSGGENTKTVERLLVAEINGQLIENKNVLSVQENLVIKGSVGYATGNIVFPGDVLVEGAVADGFKIYSGGSLTIKQTLDVTDIIAKGDLVVLGGMIGHGPALVKTGGGIKTKFIENCKVAARKTIAVDSEIINSSVFTLENIDMGEKGKIVGGDIYAVRGIRAAAIGRKTGRATKIHCGIDFTAQQEKEKNNNLLRILAAKLAKLRELLADPATDETKLPAMRQLLARLESEQNAASAKVSELMGKINADENAAVEISGEIAAGTLIEICQIALFVPDTLRKVRIKLDRAAGKLVTEQM